MMFYLLLAAAQPMTAVDAERAFAADAQALGQWTAFRKWAASDAVMFLPQPANAQTALKDRRDPPRAIRWWPTASYVSCDGATAVNTGGWRQPDGSVGFFTTVWQRQADGTWRWLVDSGDALTTARPQPIQPRVVRASCKLRRPRPGDIIITGTPRPSTEVKSGGGGSDGSLSWSWMVKADGSRHFWAGYSNGRSFVNAIADDIAAPPAPRPATP